MWPVWFAVTGCEWEGDSGLPGTVSFSIGSCCVFSKFGQEGIRVMNKNKWHNGLLGAEYSFGAIRHLNLVQLTAPKLLMQGLRLFIYDYVTFLYALYTSSFIFCAFEICHIFRELADKESKVRNASHWKANFDRDAITDVTLKRGDWWLWYSQIPKLRPHIESQKCFWGVVPRRLHNVSVL